MSPMAGKLQPLGNTQPIVDKDGVPNDYFIRWAQTRQAEINSGVDTSTVNALINIKFSTTHVIAGTGLTGGGALITDVTLNATGGGGGSGGILPVVDGQIPPNFIQMPDGNLVYLGVTA